ncbi:MAG TPA: patatin family protein [Deltaproteobacteria bacterium]|nr:patatin family protein [Deltaproteobacteria bacterium]
MNLRNTGLVLEGGGFRGIYTSGVLHWFMERDIYFPYVIGVSMGACNAASYVSRQPGRNRIVNIEFVNNSRYMSVRRLLTRGELFGMDFIFGAIPRDLVPFDFKTFFENDQICVTVVTDCVTGEAVYYDKRVIGDGYMNLLQASSTLPFVGKPVPLDGRLFMDGGLADSVPIARSIEDGNSRNVLVLTRPRGYRKKRSFLVDGIARIRYRSLPGVWKNMAFRAERYNAVMNMIDRLEAGGDIFVIRPREPVRAGRIDRNKNRLIGAYNQGYEDAEYYRDGLFSYLDG